MASRFSLEFSTVMKSFWRKRYAASSGVASAVRGGITKKRVLQDAFVAVLALCVGGAFVAANVIYNHGYLSAPIDDVFIHLQYGRQISEGQWFRYNDGAPMSTGASSLLYVILLGVGHALGFQGSLLLTFAVGVGLVLLAVTAVLSCELGRSLGGERSGLWSGVLIAVNGPFAWGATSGMEVSLLAALLSSALLAFWYEFPKGTFLATPVLLTLAALTRPEGLIFAMVMTVASLLRLFEVLRRRQIDPKKLIVNGLLILCPLAAGAGQLIFYHLATGTSVANGIQAKSVLYEPIFYPTEALALAFSRLLKLLLDVFSGLDLQGYLFPGAVLFVILGISRLVSCGPRYRAATIAAVTASALGLLSITTLETWSNHSYRYFLPFFPVLIVLAVVGISSLSSTETVKRLDGPVYKGLIGFALVFSFIALPVWAVKMGQESAEIREQQISVGLWVRSNLPPESKVAVNDAGAIRYYGDRAIVDLVGLVTNGFAEPSRSGSGSIYEALEGMAPEQRPDYFVIYPDWFEGLENSGILGEEIQSFTLLRETRITGGREVMVYKADWGLADSGNLPRLLPFDGIRDSLDVADLESERSHDYEVQPAEAGVQPLSVIDKLSYPDAEEATDGGRKITGGESFTARNLTPGHSLTIAMRTSTEGAYAEEEPVTTEKALAFRVLVDGRLAGEWRPELDEAGWQEPSFVIPAHLVGSESARIELAPLEPYYAPFQTYVPFYYWFIQ